MAVYVGLAGTAVLLDGPSQVTYMSRLGLGSFRLGSVKPETHWCYGTVMSEDRP